MEERETIRDIPQCTALAGVIPCHVVDFTGIANGEQFVARFELIGEKHLATKCNDEFMVHYNDMTARLRDALTCVESEPDHMLASDSPHHGDECNEQPIVVYQEPEMNSPAFAMWNGYKQPYEDCVREKQPGTYCNGPPKPSENCPWDGKGKYGGDCLDQPGVCNLKYFNVCGLHHYNEIFCDACQWSESLTIVPMITEMISPLGVQYEKK